MFEFVASAARAAAGGRGAVGIAEHARPAMALAHGAMRAGVTLGAVTGLMSGGWKCLRLQQDGALTGGIAVRVLGREIATQCISGSVATATLLCVAEAGVTLAVVVSAPSWIPVAAAVTLSSVAGYLALESCRRIWDHCIA
jgi:hypothetical protein